MIQRLLLLWLFASSTKIDAINVWNVHVNESANSISISALTSPLTQWCFFRFFFLFNNSIIVHRREDVEDSQSWFRCYLWWDEMWCHKQFHSIDENYSSPQIVHLPSSLTSRKYARFSWRWLVLSEKRERCSSKRQIAITTLITLFALLCVCVLCVFNVALNYAIIKWLAPKIKRKAVHYGMVTLCQHLLF